MEDSGLLYIENGTVAVGASRREQVVVVGLAVRMALPLEEVAGTKFLVAVGAGEVLRVPGLAQGRDHLEKSETWNPTTFGHFRKTPLHYLSNDGLLASTAASLLGSVDSLSAHVCLQIAEHRIQLVLLDVGDRVNGLAVLGLVVVMSGARLGYVDARLRAFLGQRAAPARLVRLRVRRIR